MAIDMCTGSHGTMEMISLCRCYAPLRSAVGMRVFTRQPLVLRWSEPAVSRRWQSDNIRKTTQNIRSAQKAQWRFDAFSRSRFALHSLVRMGLINTAKSAVQWLRLWRLTRES